MPDVAIIRATTADERGNLSYEHEGAYLGPLDQALAVRNNGGIVIAQVKRLAKAGTLKPFAVHVPGVLVDAIVVAPDQMQTTQTAYDPAISGEYFRAEGSFRRTPWGVDKVIARRVAQELRAGWAVNLGFGISAHVPRVLLEEGRHGDVTWVIEQGAVGGVPLLDFQFGCSANAEAIMPSPQQFTYFQGAGFDCSLLSFMQIDQDGSVNVSRLAAKPHVTAGCGGFVDITARARKIVFSGYFTAGAKLHVEDGRLHIAAEGKVKKLVPRSSMSRSAAGAPSSRARTSPTSPSAASCACCREGITVTELAPGRRPASATCWPSRRSSCRSPTTCAHGRDAVPPRAVGPRAAGGAHV